eukprot:COSAG02_NODE_820_length_16798_cov_10.212887_8_plen_101_part_00
MYNLEHRVTLNQDESDGCLMVDTVATAVSVAVDGHPCFVQRPLWAWTCARARTGEIGLILLAHTSHRKIDSRTRAMPTTDIDACTSHAVTASRYGTILYH